MIPQAPLRVVGENKRPTIVDAGNFQVAWNDNGNADWLQHLADGFNEAARLRQSVQILTELVGFVVEERNALKAEVARLKTALESERVAKVALLDAMKRLASGEGFEAIGAIPNDMWGRELKARRAYAEAAAERHGGKAEKNGPCTACWMGMCTSCEGGKGIGPCGCLRCGGDGV